MFKHSLVILSLSAVVLQTTAFAAVDCGDVTSDAASAISFKDRNAAIEILQDRDQKACLLPEYIVKLNHLVGKTHVKEEPLLKYPRGDISNPQKMKELCAHEMNRTLHIKTLTSDWAQTAEVGFTYQGHNCTIVMDGDNIDAMIQ